MIQAWHFVGNKLRDGRPVPPDGEWLRHDGPVKICLSGLHTSVRIVDALQCSSVGNTICRVTCDNIVEQDDYKFVCRARRIDWRIDGTDMLRTFARQCALDVVHLWDCPDIVRKYLETGDESLRLADRDAITVQATDLHAPPVVRAAARAAWTSRARSASLASALASAQAAGAAWDDAAFALWDVAAFAAWNAVRAMQNTRLESMMLNEWGRRAQAEASQNE